MRKALANMCHKQISPLTSQEKETILEMIAPPVSREEFKGMDCVERESGQNAQEVRHTVKRGGYPLNDI